MRQPPPPHDEAAIQRALQIFHAPFYIRHNQRRLEHLASLGLDLVGKTVLEPGAGVGDHTLFYLDRGCRVTALEPRGDNCAALRANIAGARSPNAGEFELIEDDVWALERLTGRYDIVHCYGLLYHLGEPARAIEALAARSGGLLLLETCVTPGDELADHIVEEPKEQHAQASTGFGCRPTRPWLARELRRHFEHVYVPLTQPAHNEFPLDWRGLTSTGVWDLKRIVMIASRTPLALSTLSPDLVREVYAR